MFDKDVQDLRHSFDESDLAEFVREISYREASPFLGNFFEFRVMRSDHHARLAVTSISQGLGGGVRQTR